MKRIMTRSYMILLVALLFVAGLGFLAVRIVLHSSDWVQQTYNGHISVTDGITGTGGIVDRNATPVAYTADGERCYHEDSSVRKALLHVLGDRSMSIATSIQNLYRADLSGYNFIFGMGLPASLRDNSSIALTVDADACKAAYEAMEGHNGACIIYNYKTGEVLVSVSNPTYDPADPPEITPENESEYEGVYLDNVLRSTYTPGSTFKVVTAACAIENIPDIDKRTFRCTGTYEVNGELITCEREEGHGELSFQDVIAHSCNCCVAQIALELGPDKLQKTAEEFGFNYDGYTMSGIRLAPDVYDPPRGEEMKNDFAWSAIGQHTDLANPAHMSMIAAAIANGGTAKSPFIVRDDGSLMSRLGIRENQAGDVKMVSSDVAARVKTIMRAAGDHYGLSIGGMTAVCAKTGTAEVGKTEDGYDKTNAWFFGFIDDERHPYAFAVIREVVKYDEYSSNESYGKASAAVIDAAISALVSKEQP